MRWVIVHYPAAHPRLTWLCVTFTAINNIPTITLVARRMQYAKLLFQSCFPCIQLFIIFISFVAPILLWNHSVCSSALISQM